MEEVTSLPTWASMGKIGADTLEVNNKGVKGAMTLC